MASTWEHPRFEKPPVIETVFSIEFAPLSRWQIPHFGLYWSSLRERYPKLNVQAALPPQRESLDREIADPTSHNMVFELNRPPIRCWFYNEPETQLIQSQNDRFMFNWKRGLVDAEYPHYHESIRPIVAREWETFNQFVAVENLGKIDVQQCEISYINHLVVGEGWDNYSQLGEVFPAWGGSTRENYLGVPEDVEIRARYLMPERQGRIYIHAQPAIRRDDSREIIQLTFVARGRPRSSDPTKVLDWFDPAQEFVGRSFLDFTSQKMHTLWGLRNTQ